MSIVDPTLTFYFFVQVTYDNNDVILFDGSIRDVCTNISSGVHYRIFFGMLFLSTSFPSYNISHSTICLKFVLPRIISNCIKFSDCAKALTSSWFLIVSVFMPCCRLIIVSETYLSIAVLQLRCSRFIRLCQNMLAFFFWLPIDTEAGFSSCRFTCWLMI